jgi:hypothetical protein
VRIGFFFDGHSEAGGIFQQAQAYYDKIINHKNDKYQLIIIVNSKKNSETLKKNKIKHLYFKKTFIQKIIFYLFSFRLFQYFFRKLKITNPFEKFLKRNQISLIVFNSPSPYIFYARNIHYVVNIWNTDLKKYNFFPEFIEDSSYTNQSSIIKEAVMYSFRIVVFTDDNIKDLELYYNCPREKILTQVIFPYLPIIYENNAKDINKIQNNFLGFDLKPEISIFLYPAQYFAHKNHKFLIDVAKNIKSKTNKKFLFLFTGIDKGNLAFLKQITVQANLNDTVKFYDNVKNEYLVKMYLICDALVSSTYIGKLSLPLLEAFYFQKPIFYSRGILDQKIEQKVFSFDLDNIDDLSKQLIDFIDNKKKFLNNIKNNKSYYDLNCKNNSFEDIYNNIFDQFIFLRNKWK